jgi:hypothetical protein
MAGRGGLTVRLDLPYLMADTDRHGNERLFVRRFGRKIRIRAKPGTTAFAKLYNAALDALERPLRQAPRGGAPAGTLGWLAATYFAAVEFTGLPTVSQSTRRGIIEACLREPIKPTSPDKLALCPCPFCPPSISACCATAEPTSRERRTIA